MVQFTKKTITVIVILLLSLPMYSQEQTIKGLVLDADNIPLPGASIWIKGTKQGTQSDFDGNFSIQAANGTILVFSYVGTKTIEKTVGQDDFSSIILEYDSSELEEVVVIGYGSVRKSDLTGAVSSVSGEDLKAVPAMNAAQALQGKAAGLNIVTSSGAPGADTNITIRGGASITQNTEPLYIVDGFEMDNALQVINSNDIESIEVLKDASSTAIYGARGSNGIIVITTKSGKVGKTSVSYNAFTSFDQISNELHMMSNAADFVKYQYELAELQGKTTQWSNVFDNSLGVDGTDFYTGVYNRINNRYGSGYAIDWQDEVFGGSALTQNHNGIAARRNNVLFC